METFIIKNKKPILNINYENNDNVLKKTKKNIPITIGTHLQLKIKTSLIMDNRIDESSDI